VSVPIQSGLHARLRFRLWKRETIFNYARGYLSQAFSDLSARVPGRDVSALPT